MRKIRKSIVLIICIFHVFCLKSQSEIIVEFAHRKEEFDFTKSFISNHEFYLLIEEFEYPIIKTSDSTLLGPKLTDEHLSLIDTLSRVIVKIKNEKDCFISLFPNVFVKDIHYLRIDFFKLRYGFVRKQKIINLWYSKKIGMNYVIPVGRSLRTGVLRLENCK